MKTMSEYLSTPEGVNQMWEKINGVLDNFDFSIVTVVMETLDWYWACTDEEAEEYRESGMRTRPGDLGWEYLPDIPHLIKTARKYLCDTIEGLRKSDEETEMSLDGVFKVVVKIDDDKARETYYGKETEDDFEHSVSLALYFIAAESTSF